MNSEKGFSLIEVMIVVGVMGIIAVGSMILMKGQQDGALQTADKLAALELASRVITTVSSGGSCAAELTRAFSSGTPYQIGSGNNPSTTITLTNGLHANANSTSKYVAKPGEIASPLSGRLRVNQIQFKDFQLISSSASQNLYSANLQITFSGSQGSIRPVSVGVYVSTDSSRNVTNCNDTESSGVWSFDCFTESVDDDGSEHFYGFCCRTHKRSGEVLCRKNDTSLHNGTWGGDDTVWTAAATPGIYETRCFFRQDNWWNCCRFETLTGSSECKGRSLSTSWYNFSQQPF